MKREFIKYGFFTLIALLIFIFIYPTIYRYDKYDQKIPVRINRITGKTEMLYSDGWTVAKPTAAIDWSKYLTTSTTPTPIPTPIIYKGETFQQYYDRVVGELDTKQTVPNKNHLFVEWEKARTGAIDTLVDPKDYFTIGSTMDQVKKAMGIPKSINKYSNYEIWDYGQFSSVTFDLKGNVKQYDNSSGNLNVK